MAGELRGLRDGYEPVGDAPAGAGRDHTATATRSGSVA
jgi:hypothetical protein